MCEKRLVTYIIIGLYYLLSGVEYAVILPTLNLYLLQLDADQFFLGLVMASFSVTGLLSAPLYGRFTDKTGSTKATVMFSNLFEIGGNFMYCVASSPIMVLGSRLVAGLGSGSGSSIFGMIARGTPKHKRTAAFSQLMALRQVGLLVGPACNLFLNKIDFYMGPFHVNSLTVPGLFMALLWTIHEILMIFFYTELVQVHEPHGRPNSEQNSLTPDTEDLLSTPNEASSNPSHNDHSYQNGSVEKPQESTDALSWSNILNDLLKEEVIVCLFVTFIVMFVQTGIETLLTPLTLRFFLWGELPNSIFFCVAGVIIIISFLVLGRLSKRVEDRLMLLVGCAVMTGLYVFFLTFIIFAEKQPPQTTWVLVLFSIFSAGLVFDLPFVWVPQASIYSKVTHEKTQAFNQGVRILVMGLGQILGPLWAASLLNGLPLFGAVNLSIVALVLIMVAASYKRLNTGTNGPTDQSDEAQPNERTRLISDNYDRQAINA